MATENEVQATMEDNIKKLFDAMDIIAAQQVKNLQFDKTVKCSITDDSKSDEGEYTVTDGSTTFKAYSESTKYSSGASVYVNIPNGDYNNRKIITGRYDKDRKDYNTNDPEKSYIDITQNLITDFNGETGLIANGPTKQIALWDSGEHFGYKLDKKDDTSDNDSGYKAYKKLFIKAKFKSWLGADKVILGNYGIRVDILGKKENTTVQTAEDWYMFKLDSANMIGDPYNFEVGFEQKIVFDLDPEVNIDRVRVVFYQDGNFYDKSKNLRDASAVNDLFVSEPYVSFGYALDEFDEDTVLLYTFNSTKYAEYLKDDVKQQLVDNSKGGFTLADLDRPEFYKKQLDELNKKKIILRWVHETTSDDEKNRSFTAICKEEEVPEEAIVHWYRYNLEEGVSDEIAGAYWVEMAEQKNKFEFTFAPNTSKSFELFKVVIENASRKYVNDFLIANDNDIINIENIKEEDRTDEQKEQLDNLKNSYLEKVHDYSSEDLKFENENMVPDANTIDLIKGLEITCDDGDGGYNGVYRIYDDSGAIMSSSESSKMRILTANYTSIVSGVSSLDTAEKIIWSIPSENTMIYPPTEDKEYSFYDKVGTVSEDDFNKNKSKYFTYSTETKKYTSATSWNEQETYYQKNRTEFAIEEGFFTITRYGIRPDASAGTEEADSTQQYFRIKDYYTQSAINNTVFCTIVKNNRTYTASFDMVFGPCGTNGTDYTFTLEFENKQPAVTCSDETVTIIPKIYDYQNKDVTEKYANKISYSWYSENDDYRAAHPIKDEKGEKVGNQSAIEIKEVDHTTGAVTLKLNTHEMSELNYFILQGKASNVVNINNLKNYKKEDSADKTVDGKVETDALTENVGSNTNKKGIDISLFTYLPIPIRRSDDYTTFDGATKIVYNTSGVDPEYYKDPYIIYEYVNKKTSMVPNINWMMSFGKDTRASDTDTTNLKYYPSLDSDNKLVVPSMYLQNNGKAVSVVGFSFNDGIQLEWIQPLYIYQNSFASSLLNSWDGSLTFDEENGTILSTMIGAGKKDSQNRFNGVLMGDLSPAFNTDEGVTLLKDYYSGIGLYGFNEGQKSFGLNINGRAFFGKSGHGQILIDGNTGTIQSQKYLASMSNYNNGSVKTEEDINDTMREGMCIDLDAGTIITYGTGTNALIKIDPTPKENGAYFEIRSSKNRTSIDNDGNTVIKPGQDLIFIGDGKYFLQSHNFTDLKTRVPELDANGDIVYDDKGNMKYVVASYGEGINFDLNNGKLRAYDFEMMAQDSKTGAYISINSNGSPYLDIYAVGQNSNKETISNHIVTFSNSYQYLRSLDYNYTKELGTEINLGTGRITSYDFGLKAIKNNKGVQINSSGNPFLKICTEYTDSKGNKTAKYLLNIDNGTVDKKDPTKDNSSFYMQSKNYHVTDGDNFGEGMYFDLKSGRITAYSFGIRAQKQLTLADGSKAPFTLIIDSSLDKDPLQVGTRFKVNWDGTVNAANIVATGGQIGPFIFNTSALYTSSSSFGGSGIYLGTSGFSVSNGNFKVDSSGNLYSSSSATIAGTTTIGGTTTINGTTNINDNLNVGASTKISGSLGVSGDMSTSGKLEVSGSTSISGKLDVTGDTSLKGDLTGNSWSVGTDGKATFENIDATGGKIGSWNINEDGTLTNDQISLKGKEITFGGGSIQLLSSAIGITAGSVFLIGSEKVVAGPGILSSTGGIDLNKNNIIACGNLEVSTINGKEIGELAFENSVKKKVNVTLTKEVSYSGQSTSCQANVRVSWSVDDKGVLTGGPWVNSSNGNKSFSTTVTATGTSSGGSKTVTIKATGAEVEISPSDKGTASLTNGSFSSVTLS